MVTGAVPEAEEAVVSHSSAKVARVGFIDVNVEGSKKSWQPAGDCQRESTRNALRDLSARPSAVRRRTRGRRAGSPSWSTTTARATVKRSRDGHGRNSGKSGFDGQPE